MKLMATLISNHLKEADGGTFSRSVVIDPKALGISEAEAKLQLKQQAFRTARQLGLGKEGRDWDVILAHVFNDNHVLSKNPSSKNSK